MAIGYLVCASPFVKDELDGPISMFKVSSIGKTISPLGISTNFQSSSPAATFYRICATVANAIDGMLLF